MNDQAAKDAYSAVVTVLEQGRMYTLEEYGELEERRRGQERRDQRLRSLGRFAKDFPSSPDSPAFVKTTAVFGLETH
jgi:hypothetical protein